MNIKTEKDSVLIGSGFLYAIEADKFTPGMETSAMTEIGYIKDNATFKRSHESKEITSANYGMVEIVNGTYTTEFATNIISYKAENVSKFLTGSKVVVDNEKKTKTTYFAEADKIPAIARVFVGEDESFKLIMPKCKWQGEYELDFNTDDPVELSYDFRCLNVTLPNGKVGAAYMEETVEDAE